MSLLADGRRDEGAERVQDHQEGDDDERCAHSPRNTEALELVDTGGDRDPEERAEERDDDDLVRDPEQLEER